MRPIDLTKFRKDLTKNLEGVSIGFHDPKYWISTGSYALNYMISGNFERGIPLGKVTMMAGSSGSGKSFLVSGNLVRNAQKEGHFVVLMDTENALDEPWLHALGVDTSEEKLLKISITMIDDVAKTITDFMKGYKSQYANVDRDDRPKVLFVIDSLGMLLTPTDVNQFEAGELKGDMGRKPKALNALIRNCVNMFGEWDVGLVCTNHTYASQDMFDPDDKITGGCFAAGQKISMEDGSDKKIETVQIGDRVITMYGSERVVNLWHYQKPTIIFDLEDGTKLEVSEEHKFLVSSENGQEWICAKDLNENDEIISM